MTIRGTGDTQLDDRLRALRGALRKLDGTDGRPRARGNARRRVLGALRALRAAVDERWPAIIQRKAARSPLAPEARRRALQAAGWVEQQAGDAATFAAAGVPIRRVTQKVGVASVAPNVKPRVTTRAWLYVPGWAAAIGPSNPARLRAAKRSNVEKRAARAEAALRDPGARP